jgi:hypothetical protein
MLLPGFCIRSQYYVFGSQCQYYCTDPDPQMDLADSLEQYDYLQSAEFVQNTTFNGTSVMEFAWTDNLGPIPMNYLYLYVDASTRAPVGMLRKLTPFGEFIGWENITWVDYTVGEPPSSAFNIPDKEYCQEGSDDECMDSVFDMVRRHVVPMP